MLKNDATINITADDRECKSEVIDSLLQIENVDVNIRRLSIGDYQVDSRLIVERKTLKDFAVSIIDGRLFKQTLCLANSNSKSVLILEGTASDTAELGMTREAMQGALITVSLILGIPVLRAKNPSETAKLMVYIARQIESMAGAACSGTAIGRKLYGKDNFSSCLHRREPVLRGSSSLPPSLVVLWALFLPAAASC